MSKAGLCMQGPCACGCRQQVSDCVCMCDFITCDTGKFKAVPGCGFTGAELNVVEQAWLLLEPWGRNLCHCVSVDSWIQPV